MESKNVILVVIAILVVALIGIGAYVMTTNSNNLQNMTSNSTNATSNGTVISDNATNSTNATVVGDNSTRVNETNTTNVTHKVYVPQTDSYVDVIGEKYDAEVNRWYTYDKDGVRYYNTRIK